MGYYLAKFAVALALCAVAALFAIAGFGFLGATAYLWLSAMMPVPWAAFATAIAALAAAAILLIVAILVAQRRRPKRSGDLEELAAALGGEAGAAAGRYARARPITTLAIALIAGVIIGLDLPFLREIEKRFRRDGRE
ncbi:MAG: hypothetical protein WCF16_00475 [Alphaproteobacteria bacterium]